MLEEDPQEEKKSHPPKKMAQEKEEDLSFEFFGRRSKGRKRIFKPPGSPAIHSATATPVEACSTVNPQADIISASASAIMRSSSIINALAFIAPILPRAANNFTAPYPYNAFRSGESA